MDELRRICVTDMEELDLQMKNLSDIIELAAAGSREFEDDSPTSGAMAFIQSAIGDFRARLDDIRGAVLRLSMMDLQR